MATTVGSGNLLFEPVENWEKLPPGWEFIDVAGVAVDSRDNVYAFNRSEHPVVVFDRDGNFLRSFGEGQFSDRSNPSSSCADITVTGRTASISVRTNPFTAWTMACTRSRNSPSMVSCS